MTAYQEGGIKLLGQRFHRWWDHQQGRVLRSKDYQRWINENAFSPAELASQREWANSRSSRQLISLVCPLHRTPIEVLEQTVQSVLEQTYPYWELCLTISREDSFELRKKVLEFADQDSRIQLIPLEKNQGISANTNAAVNVASGEWVGFLDHDDLLAPNALCAMAQHLDRNPKCDLIYTDEDVISANGRFRRSPMLKPDWSPEMLLHFNYICHFVVTRKTLIQKVGGLRPCTDGAQDWDLLLRITELSNRIHHIPHILYHWRTSKSSTAGHLEAKPYVAMAQETVLRDCFERRGIVADVERKRFGHFRPKWKPINEPLVSIIIPNRNQPKLIQQIVDGILYETAYQNAEIIIVDNQSTDPLVLKLYKAWQRRNPLKVANFPEPFNYSRACNLGAAKAKGEYLLFLNNDVEVIDPDWLSELLGWGMQPDVGIVGGHLIYPNGCTQHAGVVLGLYELAGHMFAGSPPETTSPIGRAEWTRNVSAVTGACQLVKRSLFESIGGYDEQYHLVYSDVDLCLRIRDQGLRVVYTPHCKLIHHECATRKPGNNPADARRFARTLVRVGITNDPYYHHALSAHSRCPQLKPKGTRNVGGNLTERLKQTLADFASEPVTVESEVACH